MQVRIIGDAQRFQSTALSKDFSDEMLKEVNRRTLLWKAKFNRSISAMKDQVFEKFRINYIMAMKMYCRKYGYHRRWAFVGDWTWHYYHRE